MEIVISSENIEKLQELLDYDGDFEEDAQKKRIEADINDIVERFIEGILSFFGKTQ
jgi:hypothetical protein